jgi:hypothetical protein
MWPDIVVGVSPSGQFSPGVMRCLKAFGERIASHETPTAHSDIGVGVRLEQHLDRQACVDTPACASIFLIVASK